MRRCAVLEGVEEEAELLLCLVLVDAHDREDALLDVLAVDTDRPAADLVAVADDVVGPGERVAGVGVEGVDVLGRGEGVVHGGPGAVAEGDVARGGGVGRRLEQRCVHDPEEAPGVLVDEVAPAPDLEARGTEQRPAGLDRAGGEEDAVARLGPDVGGDAGLLGIGDVLGDRSGQLPSSWTRT